MNAIGYSGKPLAEKLGIKTGAKILLVSVPDNYLELVAPLPENVEFVSDATRSATGAHVFAKSADDLASLLSELRKALQPSCFVWVSWPKKASKVETDITEDTIRAIALPMGFVDVKVCAVSEIWSGLKLVVRKELR